MGKNENLRPLTNASLAILLAVTNDALTLTRVQVRKAGNTSAYHIQSRDNLLNVSLPFDEKAGEHDYETELTKIVNYLHCDDMMLSSYYTDNPATRDARIADITNECCQFHKELNDYDYFHESDYMKIEESLIKLLKTANIYTGESAAITGARIGLTSMFYDTFMGAKTDNMLISEIAEGIKEYAKQPNKEIVTANQNFQIGNQQELDIEKEKAKIITLAIASLPSNNVRLNIAPQYNNSVRFGITTDKNKIISVNISGETKSIRSVELFKNKIYKAILDHYHTPAPILPTAYANKTMESQILNHIVPSFVFDNQQGATFMFALSCLEKLPLTNYGKDTNLITTIIANLAYLSGVKNPKFRMSGELPNDKQKIIAKFNDNYDTIIQDPKAFGSIIESIAKSCNDSRPQFNTSLGTMGEYYQE